jgi:hypothetical protein
MSKKQGFSFITFIIAFAVVYFTFDFVPDIIMIAGLSYFIAKELEF